MVVILSEIEEPNIFLRVIHLNYKATNLEPQEGNWMMVG